MNLKEAVLEEIAIRNNYDVTIINALEEVQVEQHKQRAIAEVLVSYPSLMGNLVNLMKKETIKSVDLYIMTKDPIHKPHWEMSKTRPHTAVLVINH